ncbi:tryptophan--tRNA ligase [Natronosporangium hydrolyticum]|uniref:Tryptophan--tRNA ligase n=1 Tax=Natronosporangium hydrolyticum TaxID=2811111 RepID=A0A895YPP4_9ACTN|nr:tryptophan--tRNA ligase [Natronosporangium hydrolyticum]QSB16080.1 tryptophan--tRNA ligase [Natronosporangium hydrolyticum]
MSPPVPTADRPAPTTAGQRPHPDTGRRVRRLTGLAPTGRLQLGNYLGAIRPMVTAQSTADDDANLVAIVDLHALTVDHRPHEVRAYTLEQATTLLAAGVDPASTTIYVQSQLPEHTELHYLLECVASHGEVHRMIQFRQRAQASGTGHSRLSLLTYPVLMAADILLHDTDEVPVGEDQRQHLELARDLASRFNNRYGETFTVPRAVTPRVAARIMDLSDPGAKMGKSRRSGQGVIYLLDPPDVLRRKIARAVTDQGREIRHDPIGQPGVANLLEIIAAGADTEPAEVAAGLSSYRQLKETAAEVVIDLLAPIQRRYLTLARDPHQVRAVLTAGRDRARTRASATVARARRALGLL